MKLFFPTVISFIAGGLVCLASCGGGSAPKGTIGCSCRLFMSATCEGVEAPRGLEDDLLNDCEMSFEPECISKGGLYDPILPCPSQNRFAVCEIELPTTGLVRIKVWKTPDWGDGDKTAIEADCDGLGGALRYE